VECQDRESEFEEEEVIVMEELVEETRGEFLGHDKNKSIVVSEESVSSDIGPDRQGEDGEEEEEWNDIKESRHHDPCYSSAVYNTTSGYRKSAFSSSQSIHFSRNPPFPPLRMVSPSAIIPRNIFARVIATVVRPW
jgi:hypothetical protein